MYWYCCCPRLEIIYEAMQLPLSNSDPIMIVTSLLRKSHLFCAEVVIYITRLLLRNLTLNHGTRYSPDFVLRGSLFPWNGLTLDKNGAQGNVFICQNDLYIFLKKGKKF